ncbi:Predicted arabinose efflux permease, MFS family [Geodermatophilus pulveris]|uniref:Predicted arabinose efflux permease, MFS family n=1 Tax=Geodermatophilus pulveris TaxID=1564159 RepID=A0A239I5F5_9ACTN|nr:MFS transporter [Geodermatophilus pulveris]SNS89106.1 Predicted arabinose efflux permease, MFS family [Geodermatophilus pulveris]
MDGGGAARAVVRAVSVSALGVLPAFLVGALAVQIRADLDVGLGLFGLAAATLFAVSGALARPAGRLVQRLGSRRGAALAAALATTSLTVIGLAGSPAALMAGLAVGGLGNAVAQPSANAVVSELVTDARLGVAFGIKQSSIPAATLLGGLAVPGIALVAGWRWAVAGAVALALLLLLASLAGREAGQRAAAAREAAGARAPDRGLPRGGLVVLTLGGFLGSAAATPTGVFLVDSAVAAGVGAGAAGLLFAGCSVLGLASRVGYGMFVDRHPARSAYLFIANLLTLGTLGYALMAVGAVPAFVAGGVLAYGAGWAWTGLFHFAVIRDNRGAAASVTGSVQTGLSLGAASGPLLFGVVAEAASYSAAWLTAAALSLAGAVTVRVSRRMVRRSRGLPVGRRARVLDPT